MQPAWHQKITRPLRRGFGHDGRLHLHKAFLDHVVSNRVDSVRACAQHRLHAGAAQIQVAILQANRLILYHAIISIYRRRCRLIEQLGFLYLNLNLAGCQLFIDRSRVTRDHRATGSQHILATQRLSQAIGGLVHMLGIKHQLNHTGTVPEPDEQDAAHVAHPGHPAHEGQFATNILFANLSAAEIAPPVTHQYCHCLPP